MGSSPLEECYPPRLSHVLSGYSAFNSLEVDYLMSLSETVIFAGVDTLGDHDPSSPLVVGVVLSDDSPSVGDSVLGRAVKEVRRALGKVNYVLHATDDSKSVRRPVISTFEEYGIRSRVVVFLDGGKLIGRACLNTLRGSSSGRPSPFTTARCLTTSWRG